MGCWRGGAIVDISTFLIGIASLAYLWRLKFRLKEPILVVATVAIGLLHHGGLKWCGGFVIA